MMDELEGLISAKDFKAASLLQKGIDQTMQEKHELEEKLKPCEAADEADSAEERVCFASSMYQ